MADATPEAGSSNELQEIAARLASGARIDQVIESMVERGYSREDAAGIVGHVNVELRKAMAQASLRRIRAGFLWAAGGTVVTVFTYMSASNGGTYFVAWGAIIFGVYDMIRGLIGWLQYRNA